MRSLWIYGLSSFANMTCRLLFHLSFVNPYIKGRDVDAANISAMCSIATVAFHKPICTPEGGDEVDSFVLLNMPFRSSADMMGLIVFTS